MPVFQAGSINPTAIVVPDVYVSVVPPSENYINGLPTDVAGFVGTGAWGPTNVPVAVSNVADAAQAFGGVMPRKYDLCTAVLLAQQNGANNMRCVRVTDGTDTAATGAVDTTGLSLTARYTGVIGNIVTVKISAGGKPGTFRAVVVVPGALSEDFDNIGAGLTGNAVWVAIAAALNAGNGYRGRSEFVVATAGASTTAPTTSATTLSGGADGASGIVSADMVGVDTTPRKGMYALRGSKVSVAALWELDDPATWTTQVAFGLSEGVYMQAVGPAGETIASATAAKASAGIDTHTMRVLFGDWHYFQDTTNKIERVVSPQALLVGRLAALAPQESALNKPLYGTTGTQRSRLNMQFSVAELSILSRAGIDVVANPCPAGDFFGSRLGVNASSNPVINGDNYPRLTNYIAYTLNSRMGIYVGKLQSKDVRAQALATVTAFLGSMWAAGQIGDSNEPNKQPFSVVLDKTNNPKAKVALGYMQIDVRVTYLGIITKLLINVEGGQSVNVTTVGPVASL